MSARLPSASAFGIIHLQGAVTQTVSGGSTLIGKLPPAARPNREVFTIVHTFGGTYADLASSASGQIGVIRPRPLAFKDFSFVSLEGITYQPANQLAATPIEINEDNWTDAFTPAHPGFGATPAAWYKDGSGSCTSREPRTSSTRRPEALRCPT